MMFRLPIIGHGFGPGGRFFLRGDRKLESFERRVAATSNARAKTTEEGDSIVGGVMKV